MMNRRDFCRLAAAAGLTLTPVLAGGRSRQRSLATAGEPYSGPLFAMVHAAGGWDPSLLCDPKGRHGEDDPDPVNRTYHHDEILTRGNLHFAPVGNNEVFFDKYYSDLLVLNGVDMQTNGHDSGSRHCWSGRLSEGSPSLAALLAASFGSGLPMSYLSFGGYDATAGLIAPTRSGDTGALSNLAHPEAMHNGKLYHSPAAEAAIAQARAERDQTQLDRAGLLRRRQAMNRLFTTRSGASELVRLEEYLPDPLDNSGNPLRRQAQVAVAAYRAGICVAVNMTVDGFDTHGNH
ncbi:MAG: Tat pathway signal protein, partial [Myxococcota bacterium]